MRRPRKPASPFRYFNITKTRDRDAALTLMKKALKRHGLREIVIIGGLRSYRAAMKDLVNADEQEVGSVGEQPG